MHAQKSGFRSSGMYYWEYHLHQSVHKEAFQRQYVHSLLIQILYFYICKNLIEVIGMQGICPILLMSHM